MFGAIRVKCFRVLLPHQFGVGVVPLDPLVVVGVVPHEPVARSVGVHEPFVVHSLQRLRTGIATRPRRFDLQDLFVNRLALLQPHGDFLPRFAGHLLIGAENMRGILHAVAEASDDLHGFGRGVDDGVRRKRKVGYDQHAGCCRQFDVHRRKETAREKVDFIQFFERGVSPRKIPLAEFLHTLVTAKDLAPFFDLIGADHAVDRIGRVQKDAERMPFAFYLSHKGTHPADGVVRVYEQHFRLVVVGRAEYLHRKALLLETWIGRDDRRRGNHRLLLASEKIIHRERDRAAIACILYRAFALVEQHEPFTVHIRMRLHHRRADFGETFGRGHDFQIAVVVVRVQKVDDVLGRYALEHAEYLWVLFHLALDNGNIRLDDDGVSGRIDFGIGRTASRDGLVDDRIGRYFGHYGVEPLACIYCDIFNLHCFVFRWLKNLGSER